MGKVKKCDTLSIKNPEGYADPTAYNAIKNLEPSLEESDRFHNLLDHIMYICELANFDIGGRITLIDRETNRVWK